MNGDARGAMLARIRAALGAPARSEADERRIAVRIGAPPPGPRPPPGADPLAQFLAKAAANLFTVERVAALEAAVAAVRAVLAESDAPPDISVAPALAHLPWPADWRLNLGPGRRHEALSVTPALAGIAETGSLVLVSGPGSPTTLTFLPDTHVVVLRAADVVPYPEDVWARLRAAGDGWPRTVNIVSGPSRTADVGGIIVRPAHGPKAVHLLLVDA